MSNHFFALYSLIFTKPEFLREFLTNARLAPATTARRRSVKPAWKTCRRVVVPCPTGFSARRAAARPLVERHFPAA